MAAYAALVTVMNLMEDIHNHPLLSTSLHKRQTESLAQSADFLLEFVESHGSVEGSREDLERQIASAAHAVEDAIESHVVDQILEGSSQDVRGSSLDLQGVIQAMDCVKENVIQFEEERGFKHKRLKSASSIPQTNGKNGLVRVEDEIMQLMDALTRQQPSRQIISIVGMGGIGKTTLAQTVYENKAIVRHFDFRAWATISQENNVRRIFLQLLSEKEEPTSESFDELGETLHKMLSGRRYLIVLDDMWNAQVWDKIRFFFPDNGNQSRIVITTRLSNLEIPSCSSSVKMKLLDEDKSWELFCLGLQDYPPELEEIGRKIVKKCKGLPLPIAVIGRHMGKSLKTREYWESIVNDMNSVLDSEEDEHCLDILSLSYIHLPAHLKPCFLSMGFYREDQEIYAPNLINYWVAEGFLKPNQNQSLEDIAEDHLKDLIDRNLILVHGWGHLGKIGYVKVHDLVREMCIKVGKREKFFCVLDITRAIHMERRVVIFDESVPDEKLQPEIIHALRSAPLVRCLICEGGELPFPIKLLKVLYRFAEVNGATLEAGLLQQVNLRYLFFNVHSSNDRSRPYQALHLPPSISHLWNLQTLIIRGPFIHFFAPSEIWNMRQLRHLELSEVCLPDPLPNQNTDNIALQNLHTLLGVVNLKLSEEVCRRLPNIKEMEMKYDYYPGYCEDESSCYYPNNLGRFHKLESLKITFGGARKYWQDFARNLRFPNSVRQLTLFNAPLRWEDMTMIGRIPVLRDLTLICSVSGRKWCPVEGEFCCLKTLAIIGCSLVSWDVEKVHFPLLENLSFGKASSLEEIPLDVGEIATLRCIRLRSCSISAIVSAVRLVMEQEDLGNEDIALELEFSDAADEERFNEVVEGEGFTCNNLRVLHSLF